MPGLPEIEKDFRPQLHFFVMLLVWLLCAGTAILYFIFVKTNQWRPHVFWWLLTTSTTGLAVGLAALLVFHRLWIGSRRTWSITIFLATLAPLVFYACFVWNVVLQANQRADLKISTSWKMLGIWVGNYFELESRWRNQRVTYGKHAQLFDNDANLPVDAFLEEMDRHIENMAEVLGTHPSNQKIAWVRGPLFGQTARAVGLWAICDVRGEAGKLDYLDKHEVAHCLIASLCDVDQEPPMVLAEGWAVTQSSDRDQLLQALLESKSRDACWSMMELVSDGYYGSSNGPAYHHGGPLVIYLLERFGGKKFLELYGQVRRSTFLSDAERILGISWQQLDSDFWQWLDQQSVSDRQLDAESIESPLTFRTPGIESRWNQVRTAFLEHEQSLKAKRPTSFAFEQLSDHPFAPSRLQVVLEDDRAYMISEFGVQEKETSFVLKRNDGKSFYFIRSAESVDGEQDIPRDHPLLLNIVDTSLAKMQLGSLRNVLDLDIIQPLVYRNIGLKVEITELLPGDSEELPWRMVATETWEDSDRFETELLLDPSRGFQAIWFDSQSEGDSMHETEFESGKIGNQQLVTKAVSKIADPRNDYQTRITAVETVRELTADEILQVKERVLSVADEIPSTESDSWNRSLINPVTVAAGWVVLVVLVLGIDMVGERVKIRVT